MTLPRRMLLRGLAALPAAGGLPAAFPAVTVHNGSELLAALRAAAPGGVIDLAPGDYGDVGPFTLAALGVTLRAAVPRRAVLRDPLLVEGAAARLEGLALADGRRIAGRVLGPEKLRIDGPGVEVAGCEFFGTRGIAITVTGAARAPHIHDCLFHDPLGDPDSANEAAVQVGTGMGTTDVRIGALLERNRFERWAIGSETVSVKSSGNTVRGNTLVDCRNVTNRHGEDNTYEGNALERCRGVVVHDRGTRVLRNRLSGGGSIRVMGGDIPCDAVRQGGHPQACDTFLEGNAGLLVIGRRFRGDRLPALRTVVASHEGRIELEPGGQVGTVLPPRPA